ncbi:MAG: LPS-assembly protein LptD [Hyphomicrobiales bacterium]|nr:LPS-assembly protein LptD [Hyphomicrobiales bacterium]
MRLTEKSSGLYTAARILGVASAVLVASIGAAFAAETGEGLLKQQFGANKNQPLLLQADQMVYDRQNNRVVAKGNIEIYYNNYVLLADEIIYDQGNNTLTASGNVRIKEPDGSVVNADKITLTDNFRDGFIQTLKVVTKDDARISAENAKRIDGETTEFENGQFTPCKACEKNPDAAPIWRIKATKIIHKKEEQNIYYENAKLEFFGVPLVYVPYFYHADPTVKRRSGFLTPTYSNSTELGFTAEIPYYYAFSPSYDLTVTPVVTTEAGFLLKADWRHKLDTGSYRIRVSGVYDDSPNEFIDEEFRGSIDTKGEFSLGSFWKWGWDGIIESDDTFRRFYKIDNIFATDRISQVYLTGQSEKNYFSARMYHFGGLTFKETNEADSTVHPVIDYNYIFNDPVIGGELSFNANALSLTREDGADTHRVVAESTWRKSFTDPIGQVITPFVYARGDIYRVSSFTDPISTEDSDGDTIARGTAAAGVEYRYPFVKHTAAASHTIEPIAQVIARPGVNDQEAVPNEDANSLIFDDTLLFDIDKFSGYDRLETGTRANVGAQYSFQTNSGWSVRTLAGQSYQVAGQNAYSNDTGLGETASDYVTGFYVNTPQNLRFISQSRFDQKDLELQRQDIQVVASVGPLYGAASYVDAKAQPELGFNDDREEFSGLAALRLSEFWTLFADVRYDIADDQFIRDSVGIRYADECFVLSVTYAQQFIEDGDIKPDESVLVRFELKGVGSSSETTDSIGEISPEASLIK